MTMTETVFALASGRPPAAIALIRITGPRAHRAGIALAGSLPAARHAGVRELTNSVSGDVLDRALVLRFDGPDSATGEDVVELHCHGGRAVVDAVLGALADLDEVREALPGEFTRRAFENGRIDLTEAEGLADLLAAETESQRRAALSIAEGGLRRQIDQWQEQLLRLSALAELAIDYDDDDHGPGFSLAGRCEALAIDLGAWLNRPRADPLRDGVTVVIAGPPNAGKSSLLNALVDQNQAIVTPIPGTTRDIIIVPVSINGVPLRVIDTAGLRDSEDPVERAGISRARSAIELGDVLVWLGGPDEAPDHPRTIRVHPRCDLPAREVSPPGSLAVSSVSGHGIAALLVQVVEAARRLLPADDAVALNRRQHGELASAHAALLRAVVANELVIVAEEMRSARTAFDRLTGRAGVEDVLDALFSRFCLGK